MKLLAQYGVELIDNEQMLAKILAGQGLTNTIELEAKLAQLSAKTIEGTKILANQIGFGLSKKATEWLDNINTIALKQIKADVCTILENSRPAKLIIHGCKTAIIGPPNTGKSTLLNCLAGREKAIVTDIKGTTRDWVTSHCQTGFLALELIDTAGLDEKIASAPENIIEKKSQEGTAQILEQADLVLLVLDNSQPADQLDRRLLGKITDRMILTVLNKSDLVAKFDIGRLPQNLGRYVQISAKFGTGIENLLGKIRRITGTADFDLHLAVCINNRQKDLLKRLKTVKSKRQAVSLITELLKGQV
jgi:small GTP-binding protein